MLTVRVTLAICDTTFTPTAAGMPNSTGVISRKDVISSNDAPSVAFLKRAGAIPLGVTNCSELCMWLESHNHLYGMTKNPYDLGRIAGGSSGELFSHSSLLWKWDHSLVRLKELLCKKYTIDPSWMKWTTEICRMKSTLVSIKKCYVIEALHAALFTVWRANYWERSRMLCKKICKICWLMKHYQHPFSLVCSLFVQVEKEVFWARQALWSE